MNTSNQQNNLLNELRDTSSGKDNMFAEVKETKGNNIEVESTLITRRSSRPNAGTKATRLVEMEQIGRKYVTNETVVTPELRKWIAEEELRNKKPKKLADLAEEEAKKLAEEELRIKEAEVVEALGLFKTASTWISDKKLENKKRKAIKLIKKQERKKQKTSKEIVNNYLPPPRSRIEDKNNDQRKIVFNEKPFVDDESKFEIYEQKVYNASKHDVNCKSKNW